MSRPSEVTILRRENAKLVFEIKSRDEATNRNLKIIEELRLKVIELNMENQDMEKRLAYYSDEHKFVDQKNSTNTHIDPASTDMACPSMTI